MRLVNLLRFLNISGEAILDLLQVFFHRMYRQPKIIVVKIVEYFIHICYSHKTNSFEVLKG